jgi:hypothetical protein
MGNKINFHLVYQVTKVSTAHKVLPGCPLKKEASAPLKCKPDPASFFYFFTLHIVKKEQD